MITKPYDVKDMDWDVHLPYLLFAYHVSGQASIWESPFFLLYRRDARLPTETVWSHILLILTSIINLSEAWKFAKESIDWAQTTQKKTYDEKTKEVDLRVGEHVIVLMPCESQGKNLKLARSHTEFCKLLLPMQKCTWSINQIAVALDHLQRCYSEQGVETWMGHKKQYKKSGKLNANQNCTLNRGSSYSL